MASTRSLHTATALTNGTVLIAGGFDSTMATLASAEIYDPITGLFSATGVMSAARVAAEATRLRNGQVLMVGGQDASGNAIASVDLYDLDHRNVLAHWCLDHASLESNGDPAEGWAGTGGWRLRRHKPRNASGNS